MLSANRHLTTLVASCLAPWPPATWVAQKPVTDPLADGFRNPPNAARPRVWWHWMDGNITKEGITLDLEWLHRSASAASRCSTPRSAASRSSTSASST